MHTTAVRVRLSYAKGRWQYQSILIQSWAPQRRLTDSEINMLMDHRILLFSSIQLYVYNPTHPRKMPSQHHR